VTISQREGILERTTVTDGKALVSRYTLDGRSARMSLLAVSVSEVGTEARLTDLGAPRRPALGRAMS